jgi:hypothetical protein
VNGWTISATDPDTGETISAFIPAQTACASCGGAAAGHGPGGQPLCLDCWASAAPTFLAARATAAKG